MKNSQQKGLPLPRHGHTVCSNVIFSSRIPGGGKGRNTMQNEHKRGWILYFSLLGALALLCIVACALWFALGSRPQPQQSAGYLLKDNGGHLALYAADGSGPLAEYDIYTRLLPENDVLALQQGVTVADEAELQQRLEDYGL